MIRSQAPTERQIRGLPGGRWILGARNRARKLLCALPPDYAGADGLIEGWDGISRRGRLENLLLSEHLHRDEEFLRRHLDGEQLYLSRQRNRSESGAGVLCWELTTAALGSPRLNAIGLALAFRERWAAADQPCRLLIGPDWTIGLRGIEEIRQLIEAPPRAPSPPEVWHPRILEGIESAGSGSLFWIACGNHRELAARLSALRTSRLRNLALFAVEPRRIELWLGCRRRAAPWVRAGEVEMAHRR